MIVAHVSIRGTVRVKASSQAALEAYVANRRRAVHRVMGAKSAAQELGVKIVKQTADAEGIFEKHEKS